jgi:hypothetical protein
MAFFSRDPSVAGKMAGPVAVARECGNPFTSRENTCQRSSRRRKNLKDFARMRQKRLFFPAVMVQL